MPEPSSSAATGGLAPLVLASTSPYRRALLERLGIPFRCEPPGVDEAVAAEGIASPDERARTLARLKAEAVAAREPRAVVIGSDQVCALGAEILGKAGTHARSIARLEQLSGATHRLITAVCVARGKERVEFAEVATIRLRSLTRAQIERYVQADRPYDVAGAYKLESRGIALVESIECADETAIVGLPLIALVPALERFGFEIP